MACQRFIVFGSWNLVLSATSNGTLLSFQPMRGTSFNDQPIRGGQEVTSGSPHFIVTKSQWLLLHQTMLLDLDENVVNTSKVAKFETHLHNVTSPAANCREAHKYFLLLTTWSRPEFWFLGWALRQSLSVFGSHSPWWESLCSFQNIPWDILQE